VALSVSTISPPSGSTLGSTSLFIAGTDFDTDVTVSFGGIPGTVLSQTATLLEVTTPFGPTGQVDVVVANIAVPATVTVVNGYQYVENPTIISVDPNYAPLESGTVVTLEGTGLAETVSVTIGGEECTNITIVDDASITFRCPTFTEPGNMDVILTVANGATATMTEFFAIIISGQDTLDSLILQAQQKADLQNSKFIDNAEWARYANKSRDELYDILTSKYGNNYNMAEPYVFQVTGNEQRYPLPVDFYKLSGVDVNTSPGAGSGQQWATMKQFNFGERNKWSWPIPTTIYGTVACRYALVGNEIMFAPVPQGGLSIRLWYVKRPEPMTNGTSICDGVSGWNEYVITDMAIKAGIKEESDVQALMVQKQALLDRIEAMAESRNEGEAFTVTDIRNANSVDGWSGGWDSNF